MDSFEVLYASVRPELTTYLRRLVVRVAVADELSQTVFQRWIEAGSSAPQDQQAARAWLFRVATNLAIDEMRRHATWRETMIFDLRTACEANPDFMQRSAAMVGTPETKLIARQHLASCFACTARNLSPHQAAALWLTEVHGFTVSEMAEILAVRPAQAKNWLQEARAFMRRRYEDTCALIAKQGVCYQCSELAEFFQSREGNVLAGASDTLDARLEILRQSRSETWGPWHAAMLRFAEDVLAD